MAKQPIRFDAKSMDEATHKLIEAAHHCEPLPDLSDEMPFFNFVEMWEDLCGNHAERTWLTYYPCAADDEKPAAEFNFRDFSELIDRIAGLLSTHYGIRAGGSVATLTISQPLTVAIYFAVWRLGARVVPVNPSEADDRIGYIVTNSEASLLVAHTSTRENFSGVEKAVGSNIRRAIILDGANRPDAVSAGWEDFNAVLDRFNGKPVLPAPQDVDPHADALVVYTSGTTGNPKGVVLTQHQMLADAYVICKWHAIDQHTVMMNVLPIHHVNGIVVTLLTPAYAAAQVVVNRRFRSGGFWKKLARHDVAIVSVVPTLLQFLIEADEECVQENIPNFRHFICGAGPLSVELARDFQDKFGLRIVHGYGLSETVCYSCFLPIDLEWADHTHWMYDHGFPSIGCPIDTNEMSIHDENGGAVAEGQKGEIVIRGHNVMTCYFHNPKANADAFKHGWFRSGDEGFCLHGPGDRQYYFITGRIKELIIRGGINLSPFEIDEVLMSMPGVRVGLAVGFDNRYWGEEVGAYVQLQADAKVTEADVIAYCKERLPWPKVPKVVIFGDDIPVTSTGKYQRGKLKPLYEAYKDKQFKE